MSRNKIDINKIASAAVEAALDDGQEHRRRRIGPVAALATGAALAAAAKVAASRGPRLSGLTAMLPHPDLGDLQDRVRDRFVEHGWGEIADEDEEWDDPEDEGADDEDFDDDADDEDVADEDVEDEDVADEDEPEAAADEDDDEPVEDEDEPEAAADEDDEDVEDVDEPDEAEAEDEDDDEQPAPALSRRRGGRSVDPAERPPQPPKRKRARASRA